MVLVIVSGALSSGLDCVVGYAALEGLTTLRAPSAPLSVPPLAALGDALWLGEALTGLPYAPRAPG